jgi:diguanylate cyclase (GGDEF)-like protein
MQFSPLADGPEHTYGALGIMRSTDERRLLEAELFAAAMTDPLTGLSNRRAFLAMLGHLVDSRHGGCLAMFSIDHLKAINLRYGESTGDKVLGAFADFLRAAMRSGDTISRIGNKRFAVLLPGTAIERAAEVCERAVTMLGELASGSCEKSLPVTASVGLGRIGGSVDVSVRRAELALFLARAKGRNRLEVHGEDEELPRAA